jgi:hypothetical protein
MIYDPAFDALPAVAREQVYHKLYNALTGRDSSEKWARLSASDRRAIFEIVRDTKPDLPDYWHSPDALKPSQ